MRLGLMLIAGMFGLLLLLVLCTPMEAHRRNWDGAKKYTRELIGPHALFFKWNLGISAGLFVLARLCEILGGWLNGLRMVSFGGGCKFFSILSLLGFLYLLKMKAEAQENQRTTERFSALERL